MKKFFTRYIEPNRKIRAFEITLLLSMVTAVIFCYVYGFSRINSSPAELKFDREVELIRDIESEDYDEDYTVCDVIFTDGTDLLIKTMNYEDYLQFEDEKITAYRYLTENETVLLFDHQDPTEAEIKMTYRNTVSASLMSMFNIANALLVLSISLAVILFFSQVSAPMRKYGLFRSWHLRLCLPSSSRKRAPTVLTALSSWPYILLIHYLTFYVNC